MVMVVEMKDSKIKLQDLQKILSDKGQEINLDIKAQHQDIFNVMHNV